MCVFRVGTIEQEIKRNTVHMENFILRRGSESVGFVKYHLINNLLHFLSFTFMHIFIMYCTYCFSLYMHCRLILKEKKSNNILRNKERRGGGDQMKSDKRKEGKCALLG